MKRRLFTVAALIGMAVFISACGNQTPVPPTLAVVPSSTPGATVQLNSTVIVATGVIPTSTAAPTVSGEALPSGTLILRQQNVPVAQVIGGAAITLPEERVGFQASPDTRYGVRFQQVGKVADLVLVDFSVTPNTTKDIPSGKGFVYPVVTWKPDASGFAFYDFPEPQQVRSSSRTLYYYDLASGQTTELIKDTQSVDTIPASIAFSPDGKLLLYALNNASSEGIGGEGNKAFLYNLETKQQTELPSAVTQGVPIWLGDSSGFITTNVSQENAGSLVLYKLASLDKPVTLTPNGASDQIVDVSPDGKYLAVISTTMGNNPVSNVYIMNLDGSSRRQLTAFKDGQQTLTALIWGNDGIYYSQFGLDSTDTTWRMDLDGKNATKLANGTLERIIGVR